MIRHLPNLVSCLRLLAAPVAAWLILDNHDSAALLVFMLAGASDAVDGTIARRWGVTSDFGAWLDPTADKLLMLMCFTALYGVHAAPLWLVFIVVGRDAAIAAAWLLVRHLALPVKTQPLFIGKLSTLVQALTVFALLLLLAFDLDWPRLAGLVAGLCAAVTLASGLAYANLFFRSQPGRGRAA